MVTALLRRAASTRAAFVEARQLASLDEEQMCAEVERMLDNLDAAIEGRRR